jgi:Hypothetical glycosyl hydrolase family 15
MRRRSFLALLGAAAAAVAARPSWAHHKPGHHGGPPTTTTLPAATTTTGEPVPTTFTTPTTVVVPPPPTASFNRLLGQFTDSGEAAQLTDGTVPADAYAWLVVHWSVAGATLDAIKATHPHAKVLAYQNLGGMIAGPHTNSRPTTLVTQEEADTHGEGADSWYLHKESDSSIVAFSDFAFLRASHIGRTSWRTQAQNHLAGIKADGFDGVMLDDVNMKPGHGFNEGDANDSVEFASNVEYRDAVVAAMAALTPAARAEGLAVVPNVGMDPWAGAEYPGFTAMLAAGSLDGFLREFTVTWSNDTILFDGATWRDNMKAQTDAEAAGRFGLFNTYPLQTPEHDRTIRYGLATYYLFWDGVAASGFGYDDGRPLASYGQYSRLLGMPTETKQLVSGTSADGAWMRHYTGGVVCANAKTTAGLVTFNLGGSYLDQDSGAAVTSVQLDTKRGMVLRTPG